jgi:hypothetical protein
MARNLFFCRTRDEAERTHVRTERTLNDKRGMTRKHGPSSSRRQQIELALFYEAELDIAAMDSS